MVSSAIQLKESKPKYFSAVKMLKIKDKKGSTTDKVVFDQKNVKGSQSFHVLMSLLYFI
jgi:hypothetical protein